MYFLFASLASILFLSVRWFHVIRTFECCTFSIMSLTIVLAFIRFDIYHLLYFGLLPLRLVSTFPHLCCAATHHCSLFLHVSHVVPRLAGIFLFFNCLSWREAFGPLLFTYLFRGSVDHVCVARGLRAYLLQFD